jgi:hypothetical protein
MRGKNLEDPASKGIRLEKSPTSPKHRSSASSKNPKPARIRRSCVANTASARTFYKWKAKYGGLEISDVAKMRALEDENRRLKRIVADLTLNVDASIS